MLVGTDLSKSNPHLWPDNKAHITFNFNIDFLILNRLKVLVSWGIQRKKNRNDFEMSSEVTTWMTEQKIAE
jgi:hypothetical protein